MRIKINGETEVEVIEKNLTVVDKRLYNTETKEEEGVDGDVIEFITKEDGIRRWHRGSVDGYTCGNTIKMRGGDKKTYKEIVYKAIEHVSTVTDYTSFEKDELIAATEAL